MVSWPSKSPICLSDEGCLFSKENFHCFLNRGKAQALPPPQINQSARESDVRADLDSRTGSSPWSWRQRMLGKEERVWEWPERRRCCRTGIQQAHTLVQVEGMNTEASAEQEG